MSDPLTIPEDIMKHKLAIIKAHETRIKKSRKKLSPAERIAWICAPQLAFDSYESRGFLTVYDAHQILSAVGAYLISLPEASPDYAPIYAWWAECGMRIKAVES